METAVGEDGGVGVGVGEEGKGERGATFHGLHFE